MPILLEPSMMCSNYANLEQDVRILEKCGVNYLHVDIMDGHYVPNMTVGPDYVKCLHSLTKIPLDIHLMTEEPQRFVTMFEARAGDRMSIHFEATPHPHRCLKQIQALGLQAGLAINPSTTADVIGELLYDVDFVQVMTVNPGFAGQALIPQCLPKVARLSEKLGQIGRKADIVVDGSVQFNNLLEIVRYGATSLILGPFTCFNKDPGIAGSIAEVKRMLREGGFA